MQRVAYFVCHVSNELSVGVILVGNRERELCQLTGSAPDETRGTSVEIKHHAHCTYTLNIYMYNIHDASLFVCNCFI